MVCVIYAFSLYTICKFAYIPTSIYVFTLVYLVILFIVLDYDTLLKLNDAAVDVSCAACTYKSDTHKKGVHYECGAITK